MIETLEDNFKLYCGLIGFVGNALTSSLLIKRITRKRFTKTPENRACDNFERKHNHSIYLYFIGICISDLIFLINLSINKILIETKLDVQITFDNERPQNLSINYSDFIEFTKSLNMTLNGAYYSNTSSSNNNYFVNIDHPLSLLKQVWDDNEKTSINLTNIQGVCQFYNYFSIAALSASFSFTLAALLDRLFKHDVIYNVYILKSAQNLSNVKKLELVKQETKTFIKNSPSKMNTKHSELVRQLFGKSSVFLIGIIVALFHVHLLWIFGSLPSYLNETKIRSNPIGFKRLDETINQGHFTMAKSKPDCTLLNPNLLPYFVIVFDLFLLLIFSILGLVISGILIKYIRQKEEKHQLNTEIDASTSNNELKLNKNKYLIVNCTLAVSIFSFVLNIPSLMGRIVLMKMYASLHESSDSSQVLSSSPNEITPIITNLTTPILNTTLLSNSNVLRGESDYFSLVFLICSKLDLLLELSSSHKFLIFITQCNLIRLPFWFKNAFKR